MNGNESRDYTYSLDYISRGLIVLLKFKASETFPPKFNKSEIPPKILILYFPAYKNMEQAENFRLMIQADQLKHWGLVPK